MRAIIVSIAFAALAAWADDARACGTWSLEDHEMNGRVVFHASTVSIESRDGKRRDIIRIDDAGTVGSVHSVPHGWTKHAPPPPEHTFEGRNLLHRGKPIGAFTDNGFTIGARNYVVTTARVPTTSHPADDVDIEPQWVVDVKVDGKQVLSGVGRTICFGDDEGKKPSDEVQRQIMLRRIVIYLAASR